MVLTIPPETRENIRKFAKVEDDVKEEAQPKLRKPYEQKRVPWAIFEDYLNNAMTRLNISGAAIITEAGYKDGGNLLGEWRKRGDAPEVALWAVRGVVPHLAGTADPAADLYAVAEEMIPYAVQQKNWSLVRRLTTLIEGADNAGS